MPTIPFADDFLASSLLTILLPLGVLIALAIWYAIAVKRVPEETPVTSATLPSSEVIATASPPAAERQPAEPSTDQP